MESNVVADYMSGNTRIVIKNDCYVSSDECDRIYERISRLVAGAYLRQDTKKDAP